jgi:hypothetical protein
MPNLETKTMHHRRNVGVVGVAFHKLKRPEIERHPNAHHFTYTGQDIIFFAGRFLTVTRGITYCKIGRVITNFFVSSLYISCCFQYFPYEPCILVGINGEDHFIANTLPLCSIFALGHGATTLPAKARLTAHLQSRGGVAMGLSTPKRAPSG